jgi:hypothetical protein
MKGLATWSKFLLALALGALVCIPAQAQHAFDGNTVYGNFLGPCKTRTDQDWDACTLMWTYFAENDSTLDPELGDPFNHTAPNWVPALTGGAVAWQNNIVNVVVHEVECDMCEDCPDMIVPANELCYRGALPPAEWGTDWTQGWTYYDFDGEGRTDLDYTKPLVDVAAGTYMEDLNWVAENNYYLRGRVTIATGYTLTIEAGTAIFGEELQSAFLEIQPGARIEAIGTADAPIIMTTDQAPGDMTRGGWGGLVIHGLAVANCADCLGGEQCESEGITEPPGLFCGDDDCDDSGILRYVRVEYAGHEIAPTNELNAFTFNGVGCYTDVSYCQAHMGSDDLFEWFGGRMQAHHLVGTGGADDGLDWQMGFRGIVQFAVIQHYADAGDRAIEGDNNEFDYDAPCRSNATLANLTLIGPNTTEATCTYGIKLRRGTNASIYNSIVMGWPEQGLDVQHAQSVAGGVWPATGVACGADAPEREVCTDGFQVQTFPNPVQDVTRFAFEMPAAGHAQIDVFDASGRLVDNVLSRNLSAGVHEIPWQLPAEAGPGAYFYRVQTERAVDTGYIFKVAR